MIILSHQTCADKMYAHIYDVAEMTRHWQQANQQVNLGKSKFAEGGIPI